MTAYDLVLQGLEYYREAGFIKENTRKAFQFFNNLETVTAPNVETIGSGAFFSDENLIKNYKKDDKLQNISYLNLKDSNADIKNNVLERVKKQIKRKHFKRVCVGD